MSNNSDYSLPFTNLYDLLPFKFKGDVNKYINANVFNRYLSKDESTFTFGSIGQRNTSYLSFKPPGDYVNGTPVYHDTRIPEPTILRQAWQLEPVLYIKLATVESITSWENVENELANTGIDINRDPIWGNALQFNWAPPIDPDKFLNYTDYYWYDPTGLTVPNYITIKNLCRVYQARVHELTTHLNALAAIPTTPQSELDALELQLTEAQILQDCACAAGSVGWDSTQWDDNPVNWWMQVGNFGVSTNGGTIPAGSWTTANPPPGPRAGHTEDTYFWWDLSIAILKFWNGTAWVVSTQAPGEGLFDWDYSTACVPQTDPWSQTNLWYNRADLPSVNGALQARRPILEFNPYLELNEWTFVQQIWYYRANFSSPWILSTTEPTLDEMTLRYQVIGVNTFTNQITIADDHTALFVPGFKFTTEDEFGVVSYWTTVSSLFALSNTTITVLELPLTIAGLLVPVIGYNFIAVNLNQVYINGDQTSVLTAGDLIKIEASNGLVNDGTYPITGTFYNNVFLRTEITLDTSSNPFFNAALAAPLGTFDHTDKIAPFTTSSKGDLYIGFLNQWALTSIAAPVPVNLQGLNTLPDHADYASVLVGTNIYILPFQAALPLNVRTADTPITPQEAAHFLAHTNAIRVYVDGVRSYGTYEEGTWNGTVFTPATNSTLYANAIRFIPTNVPPALSTVTIEFGPAALSDIGYDGLNHDGIQVRTSIGSILTTAIKNLIHYRRVEQVKTKPNQYPLFDLFNIDGTSANIANSIFQYLVDPIYPVDPYLGFRAAVLNNGRDYIFEQLLLTPSGGMYAYIDLNSIASDDPTGIQTIWRHGLNNEQYIPGFVNQYRLENGDTFIDFDGLTDTAIVNASNGTWDLPNQLFFNPEHENRQQVHYSDLVTHYTTIIADQPPIPGFEFVTTSPQRLLLEYNYGLGGTIHDYNDSYDTFLSAINDNVTNPQGVIDFAEEQYVNDINTLLEVFYENIISYLSNTSVPFLTDLTGSIVSDVINNFEENEQLNIIYGDTTAYDPTTGLGVKNWIATIPVFNLSHKVFPYRLVDPKLSLDKLIHHDGHLATYQVSTGLTQNIFERVVLLTGGLRQPLQPLYTQVVSGLYWYKTTTKQLFRFVAISVGLTPPASSAPDGAFWFNTGDNFLYFRDPSNFLGPIVGWTKVYPLDPPGRIDAAFQQIVLEDITTSIVLGVENQLYDVPPPITTPLAFDYQTQLLFNPTEIATFQEYMKEEYYNYLQANNLNPFATDFVMSDAFTWNYRSVSTGVVVYPTAASASNFPWAARYIDIYRLIYGTSYPHLEPWILQGYSALPTWWNGLYADTTNTRRWTSAMWSNIMAGIVPAGEFLPDGVTISTGAAGETTIYAFVSVNITGTTIDGYAPDDLIPPYYSNNPTLVAQALLRNISFIPLGHIADTYPFGDDGPTEQQWRESPEFRYDILKVAYRMQPVRFLHYSWGELFTLVAGLQVDTRTSKVYSHRDTVFHGDLIDTNVTYQLNGLNQWYINFIRFGGYDINLSDFKPKWTGWSPLLAYLTSSMIDSKTLNITNKFFDMSKNDYFVTLKRSYGVESFSVDELKVTVDGVGLFTIYNNSKVPLTDGADWTFNLSIPSPVSRTLESYGVKKYPSTIDNLFSIVSASSVSNTFVIAGNQTAVFVPGKIFVVLGTNLNDSNYATISSSFAAGNTTIAVAAVPFTQTSGGIITDSIFTLTSGTMPLVDPINSDPNLTWTLGTQVFIESTGSLPAPFLPDTPYYLIPLSTTQYKLAFTYTDAQVGLGVTPTTNGSGVVSVSQVSNSFLALNGFTTPNLWKQYALDTRVIVTALPPFNIVGIQNLIDFIYGYAAFNQNQGFVFNDSSVTETDQTTQRMVSWQFEIENLINIIYNGLGGITTAILEPEMGTNTISFVEVSPFKNAIWFAPDKGIVSNINTGPFSDIRTSPCVYDQFGNPVAPSQIVALREDKLTRVFLPTPVGSNYTINGKSTEGIPGNNLHIGGLKLFIDIYENIIIFNDYTVNGDLIYDPFLGLSTAKFTLMFQRNSSITFRPNYGGAFLQGNNLTANFEATIGTLPLLYDTFTVNEEAPYVPYARAAVGYHEPAYFQQIEGITEKSKFLFWKGLIHYKGTVAAVNAFINARLFVGAEVDEFWAYKISEYGDSREKIKPEVKLFTSDVVKNEIRFQFTSSGDPLVESFQPIVLSDQSRWLNQPDALEEILPDSANGNLYFDAFIFERVQRPPFTTVGNSSFIKIETPANEIRFTFNNGTQGASFTGGVSPLITFVGFTYILDSENLDVFKNSVLLVKGVDYTETSPSSITLTIPPIPADVIKVQKRVGVFVDGIHYQRINQRIIEMLITPLEVHNLVDYTVYIIELNKKAVSPVLLMDNLAGVILDSMQYWNPALGYHNSESLQSIDLSLSSDPAKYTNNLDTNISTYEPLNPWNQLQVGTTWFDLSTLNYKTYYDDKVFDENTRIFYWGHLSDFAVVNIYEWVESDVLPSQWNALVAQDANDLTIPNDQKHTGTPLQRLYTRTLNPITNVFGPWIELDNDYFQEYDMVIVGDTQTLTITDFDTTVGDLINVYVNGFFVEQVVVRDVVDRTTVPNDIFKEVTIETQLNPQDTVRLIKPLPTVSTDAAFVIATSTSTTIQYQTDYPYTAINTVDNFGNVVSTKYYFWVRGKLSPSTGHDLSISDAAAQLAILPSPYVFFQDFQSLPGPEALEDDLNTEPGFLDVTPGYYSQIIIKGVGNNIIQSNDRYSVRFTKDFTLRDSLEGSISLKNKHEEWELIRQQQSEIIPLVLWNRVTESIAGFLLSDPTTPVPSLNRVFYDQQFGTSTQWGLGDQQSFVSAVLAVNTIINEINDTRFDLSPIDRDVFFATYSFDTPTDSIAAMNAIYNTFPPLVVNRIWFSVLMDALTLQSQMTDLFKTSYLALQGVRLLETSKEAIDD
jgi:hypothetical protein